MIYLFASMVSAGLIVFGMALITVTITGSASRIAGALAGTARSNAVPAVPHVSRVVCFRPAQTAPAPVAFPLSAAA